MHHSHQQQDKFRASRPHGVVDGSGAQRSIVFGLSNQVKAHAQPPSSDFDPNPKLETSMSSTTPSNIWQYAGQWTNDPKTPWVSSTGHGISPTQSVFTRNQNQQLERCSPTKLLVWRGMSLSILSLWHPGWFMLFDIPKHAILATSSI